jgi:hypothetical protein
MIFLPSATSLTQKNIDEKSNYQTNNGGYKYYRIHVKKDGEPVSRAWVKVDKGDGSMADFTNSNGVKFFWNAGVPSYKDVVITAKKTIDDVKYFAEERDTTDEPGIVDVWLNLVEKKSKEKIDKQIPLKIFEIFTMFHFFERVLNS